MRTKNYEGDMMPAWMEGTWRFRCGDNADALPSVPAPFSKDAELERLDLALRRIALYKGANPAKSFDHCVGIARYALYPE